MPLWYAASVVVRVRLIVPLGATSPPHARAEIAEPSTRTAAGGAVERRIGSSFRSVIAVGRHERPLRFPPMLRPMQLNPTEEERLRVFTAAQLARATLERGVAVNAS